MTGQGERNRIFAVVFLGVLIGAALVTKALYVQVIRDPRLAAQAKRQFQSRVLLSPKRGSIVDRNGEPLAVNVDSQSLAANPMQMVKKREMARLIGKAIDMPAKKVLDKISLKPGEKREFTWIKRHLSDSEVAALRRWNLMDSGGELVEGLWLVKESKRAYPHGELAAHVLGSVNLDSEGLEGAELWNDKVLKGRVANVTAVKDALGRPAFLDAVAAQHLRDGAEVRLTIDASLQFSVQQELHHFVQKTASRSGSVIVMDADTGEILALANEPTFNPNVRGAAPDQRRNRAFTDGYEPGSTVKPLVLATALLHGWKLDDRIWGERGSFVIQGRRISEAESHEKFEWLSLKKMVHLSSNVVAAKLALKLGPQAVAENLEAFGLTQRTGSGFPGEIAGRMPSGDASAWQPLTTANVGFGQGLLVTPIQMLRAYAAIANGGMLVRPKLLQTQLEERGSVTRVLSENAAKQVSMVLQGVTQKGGNAMPAALEGYRVAGKTGTAQVVDPATKKYSRSRYIASFIGFPVGVTPRVVILTMLDEPKEPKGNYYAVQTAAPLFREVLSAVVGRYGIPSDPKLLTDGSGGSDSDAISLSMARTVPVAASLPVPSIEPAGATPDGKLMWKVPSLKGLSAREALRVLGGHPFSLEMTGQGVVTHQRPEPGKPITETSSIRLTLGNP